MLNSAGLRRLLVLTVVALVATQVAPAFATGTVTTYMAEQLRPISTAGSVLLLDDLTRKNRILDPSNGTVTPLANELAMPQSPWNRNLQVTMCAAPEGARAMVSSRSLASGRQLQFTATTAGAWSPLASGDVFRDSKAYAFGPGKLGCDATRTVFVTTETGVNPPTTWLYVRNANTDGQFVGFMLNKLLDGTTVDSRYLNFAPAESKYGNILDAQLYFTTTGPAAENQLSLNGGKLGIVAVFKHQAASDTANGVTSTTTRSVWSYVLDTDTLVGDSSAPINGTELDAARRFSTNAAYSRQATLTPLALWWSPANQVDGAFEYDAYKTGLDTSTPVPAGQSARAAAWYRGAWPMTRELRILSSGRWTTQYSEDSSALEAPTIEVMPAQFNGLTSVLVTKRWTDYDTVVSGGFADTAKATTDYFAYALLGLTPTGNMSALSFNGHDYPSPRDASGNPAGDWSLVDFELARNVAVFFISMCTANQPNHSCTVTALAWRQNAVQTQAVASFTQTKPTAPIFGNPHLWMYFFPVNYKWAQIVTTDTVTPGSPVDIDIFKTELTMDAFQLNFDTDAPRAVTGASWRQSTGNNIIISWNKATGGTPPSGFRVNDGQGHTCQTVTATECTIYNLSIGATYNFNITAVDSNGWVSPAFTLQVKRGSTPQSLPSIPASVKKGKKVTLPLATVQGTKLSWSVKPLSTSKCQLVLTKSGSSVVKAELKGLKLGGCDLAATAPKTAALGALSKTVRVSVK